MNHSLHNISYATEGVPRAVYDLVSVGSGPAGQRAALQGAKAGAKAAVVDRREELGGVCLHAGTIPSKTLREAVLFLRGHRQKQFYGDAYAIKRQISLSDLQAWVNKVFLREIETLQSQLKRNGVDTYSGQAELLSERELLLRSPSGEAIQLLEADTIFLATGTVPRRPQEIPFDQEVVYDSNFIFSTRNRRKELPESLIIVGAGVIGSEYASIFGALGIKVYLLDQRQDLFRFVDSFIVDLLKEHLRSIGVELYLGVGIGSIERSPHGKADVHLASGERLTADAVLYAMGRQSCVEPLHLERVGIELDSRGVIPVDAQFRTVCRNIFAVGDVIGFPALASTSFEQGRIACRHALGLPVTAASTIYPYGIYTIPEISMVGETEQDLVRRGGRYAAGMAHYKEISKAVMIGDQIGALKLVFDPTDLRLLGVHIIGDHASELVHIGQAVMAYHGKVDYFIDSIFNYPTLAEAYKVAALKGINTLGDGVMPPAHGQSTPR